MFTPFRLSKTIGEAYSMDLEDALNTKRALAALGHLEEPDDGFDEYPDRPMIDAVRSFQRANDLAVDGVMKPDGPTLKRLNETLAERQVPAAAPSSSSLGLLAGDADDPLRHHRASLPARPGAHPARPQSRTEFEEGQLALAPVALLTPVAGAAARAVLGQAARKAIGAGSAAAAGAAGAAINDAVKEGQKPAANPRIDIMPPMPPLPGFEPPKEQLPNRMENIPESVELPDLSGPLPAHEGPTIFILPAPKPGEFGDGLVERKGNEATRKELERIRDYFEQVKGWEHVAGGRYSPRHRLVRKGDKNAGDEQEERHIKGHFRSLKGGHFTDLTFVDNRGRTIHIQSVDVDKNGKPTQRELDNAEKIRRATENEDILLIPKGAQLKRNQKLQ